MARLEYAEEHLSEALQLLETAAKLDPKRARSFAGFLERVRREASVEELCGIPGIGRELALAIRAHLES